MQASLSTLICKQLHELMPVALRLTRDRDEAADLFQETAYKALRFQKNYQHGTNISAWLYTIMKNTFINAYRKHSRMRVVNSSYQFDEMVEVAGAEPADHTLFEKELHQLIQTLPDIFRSTFLLYIEGYKYDEIADILNQPLGTIKSRIHFTRKLLAKRITRN